MIPIELKERKQWICWRYEKVQGREKPTKIPYDPITGFKAKSTDPRTWTDFETAKANMGRFSGIGFVFSKDDPYVGIDLDGVLDKDGKFIQKDAQEIFDTANSYTEISPSGTGIHIIGKATLTKGKPRNVKENEERGTCEKEMYEFGRYFTVTGHQMGDCSEIKDIQSLTNMLEDRMQAERDVNNGKAIEAANVIPEAPISSKKEPQKAQAKEPQKGPSISPGLMQFTNSIYPNASDSVKKALQVQKLIAEINVTKIVKSKDLFIDYTRNGVKQRAIIHNDGPGFQIPQEPTAQKAYIYAKLIRHIDRTKQQDHLPNLADMHDATKSLVSLIENECKEKGMGAGNERLKVSLHELSTQMNRAPGELWNEIQADMAAVPALSGKVQIFKELPERPQTNYLMIQKDMIALFEEGKEREQILTQNVAKEQEKAPPVKAAVRTELMRPVVKNMYISSEEKASFQWLTEHNITCKVMTPQELDNKQVLNCSLSDVDLGGHTFKGTIIKDSQIDSLRVDEKTDLSNVVFEKCRISSTETFDKLVEKNAVIKDCMVRGPEMVNGETKLRWSLKNKEKGRVTGKPSIQCLAMPGSKTKSSNSKSQINIER